MMLLQVKKSKIKILVKDTYVQRVMLMLTHVFPSKLNLLSNCVSIRVFIILAWAEP